MGQMTALLSMMRQMTALLSMTIEATKKYDMAGLVPMSIPIFWNEKNRQYVNAKGERCDEHGRLKHGRGAPGNTKTVANPKRLPLIVHWPLKGWPE